MISSIKHLLHSDFDGTIANTSALSPNSVSIENAYLFAVSNVFGDVGVQIYEELGGIKSRDPGEMVRIMLDVARSRNLQMDNDDCDHGLIVTELINQKLSLLIPEISPQWPLLFPGFKEMYTHLRQLGIELTIISNGHDEFISRVFDINGLPTPEIIVTGDTLRALGVPTLVKPHPYSVEVATQTFVNLRNTMPLSMMYLGDSDEKDGGMARNAGIPFGFFNRSLSFDTRIDNKSREIAFRDFRSFDVLLRQNQKAFMEGIGFDGIFLNGVHPEGYKYGREQK